MRRIHTHQDRVLAGALCALALGSCGGDSGAEDKKIRSVILEGFTSKSKSKCTQLATQAFVEQSELRKGRRAISECKEDADENSASSVDITKVDVDGDRATARFKLIGSTSGYREVELELAKTGESWKLDRITDVKIDRDEFFKDGRKDLTTPPGALPEAVADCVLDGYRAYSDREIEQAIVKPDVARLVGPVFPCQSVVELKKRIPPAAAKCVGRGLDRAQRTGRLAKLLGDARTLDELDSEAFQDELRRLVTICVRRSATGRPSTV